VFTKTERLCRGEHKVCPTPTLVIGLRLAAVSM